MTDICIENSSEEVGKTRYWPTGTACTRGAKSLGKNRHRLTTPRARKFIAWRVLCMGSWHATSRRFPATPVCGFAAQMLRRLSSLPPSLSCSRVGPLVFPLCAICCCRLCFCSESPAIRCRCAPLEGTWLSYDLDCFQSVFVRCILAWGQFTLALSAAYCCILHLGSLCFAHRMFMYHRNRLGMLHGFFQQYLP